MPNHYHFLVKQKTVIPLAKWIKSIFIGYVQAVNKQQGISGTLFEGRAKSILVNEERYLLYLLRYIHLNPVNAGMVKDPAEWDFSNYLECIGRRKSNLWSKEFITDRFGSLKAYELFMQDSEVNFTKVLTEKFF